jgi:hypothetical protein
MVNGAGSGWKALVYRYKSCRSGYMCYLNPVSGHREMALLTGEVIKEDQMANHFSSQLT